MLDINKKAQFSQILKHLADSLDISETRYKDAVEKYEAVGKWLSKDGSPLAVFNPEISPQGSFNIGTVTKPINHEDEYDIDLVCLLNISIDTISQQLLKKMVGDRLKANKIYEKLLDKEGRRCWTLNYANDAKFHMDILPAIPDEYLWLVRLGVPYDLAKHAICITDKKTWDDDSDWPRSNPKGYAAWFRNHMAVIFAEQKRTLALRMKAHIDDVPDYQVKTPLQRSIQILKRHRDIMFIDDPENKPISMIITTLAALAYNNETDLYDSLISIVRGMPAYISSQNGSPWVPNPVNPKENFADKWTEYPERAGKFQKWLGQVEKDITSSLEYTGINKIGDALKPALGERSVDTAMTAYGKEIKNQRQNGQLKMVTGTGILGISGQTPVKDHTFYGKV